MNQTINQTLTIRLYITAEHLDELKPEAKNIFRECDKGSKYYAELPATIQAEEFLSAHIIAACETLLIMMNDKYEVDDKTELSCELLKLGKTEKAFSLLIRIQYPSMDKAFHDIMMFQECEVEELLYSFEYLGDQRMFAAE